MLKRILAIIILVLGIFAYFGWATGPSSTSAITYGEAQPCSGIYVTNPTPGQVVSTPITLRLSPITSPLSSVVFYANNISLGNASLVGTAWEKPWSPTQLQNNQYGMWALVTFSNTSSATISQCATPQVNFTILNPTTSTTPILELLTEPSLWTGPTNVAVPFSARLQERSSSGVTKDVSTQANFAWSTSIGAIETGRQKVLFSSGPATGTGYITVTAGYGGKTINRTIAIKVVNNEQTSSYPILQTVNQSGNSNTTTTSTQSIPTATLEVLKQGDKKLTTCLQQSMGDRAGSRMTFKDFAQTRACFKERRYVVPANLAPVKPEKVKQLPESIEVSIQSIRGEGTNTERKIIFSGRANPNQVVFIYVFSEPLVLTAQADGSGQWSYTLENPLESGQHEVFVAVEKGNNEAVRSAGSVFGVQAVAATPENPGGLSLLLEQQKTQPISLYIFATLAMIVLSFGLILVIRHKRHHALHGPELLPAHNEPQQQPTPPATQPFQAPVAPLKDSSEDINDKSL